ncbi:hypothetical protein AAFN85_05875 [Mucilaginibacter sp. CAU 1740]|uniref:hypothetical protein n=1 Tax=Mucilaginibacter sp. CAU 1740 TaxID=3140365 RepID=UPI00325BB43B
MALKKFAQTRWNVEAQRVTLYPYRIFNALSIAFGIILIGFMVVAYIMLEQDPVVSFSTGVPMFITFAIIVALIWAVGRTVVVFDNEARMMRKKLFGVLSIRSERFDDLANVGMVRNTMGGFNYRAFPKRDKYGKGVVVSASYAKDDDPNAIALSDEAFSVISKFLSAGYQVNDNAQLLITDFKFYDNNPPYYSIKRNVVGGLIIGLALLAVGVNELINHSITHDSDTFHKVLVIVAFLGFGAIFAFSAFTKVTFDTNAKTVSRENLLGIGNQTYSFADFINFQITRRTTNMIYSGTDVKMYFQIPGSNKQKILPLKSFRSTKKIDRFLEESRYIMGIR